MANTPFDHSKAVERLRGAVVVAHPDDETLWCGGFILTHPEYHWRILTLCRASDPDRAPKFRRVLKTLGAEGEMGDFDDGPEQNPLPMEQVEAATARLLAGVGYDLVLTHGPSGEYTEHRRHSECSQCVVDLWCSGGISTRQLWLFAYEDGNREYLSRVRGDADRREELAPALWLEKQRIITDLYGFNAESWEARTNPKEEGFWCFNSPEEAAERTGQAKRTALPGTREPGA
jgi:LmbE family N-acetylglucosaminyl deacetylase